MRRRLGQSVVALILPTLPIESWRGNAGSGRDMETARVCAFDYYYYYYLQGLGGAAKPRSHARLGGNIAADAPVPQVPDPRELHSDAMRHSYAWRGRHVRRSNWSEIPCQARLRAARSSPKHRGARRHRCSSNSSSSSSSCDAPEVSN